MIFLIKLFNLLFDILKRIQQHMAYFFAKTAFYMQGQMAINKLSRWHREDFSKITGGFFIVNDNISNRQIVSINPWDLVRRDMIILLLRSINERDINGDLVELGVYKGFTAKLLHYYMPDRVLYLFDTFSGFDKKDVEKEGTINGTKVEKDHFTDTKIERVLEYLKPINENVIIYPGYFPESIPPEIYDKKFSFVHLDVDLYEPTLAGLQFFYDRVSAGGFLLIHDYNAWIGCRRAIEEFFADKSEIPIPMPDMSGSALIIKSP